MGFIAEYIGSLLLICSAFVVLACVVIFILYDRRHEQRRAVAERKRVSELKKEKKATAPGPP